MASACIWNTCNIGIEASLQLPLKWIIYRTALECQNQPSAGRSVTVAVIDWQLFKLVFEERAVSYSDTKLAGCRFIVNRERKIFLFSTDRLEWLKQPGRYCREEEGQFPGMKRIEMSQRLCWAPYGSRRLPTHGLVPARAFRGCTTLWDIYGRNQRQGWRRSGEERAEENGGTRGWSLVCTVLWQCPGPHKCQLSRLIKFHFWLCSWGRGFAILHTSAHMEL